MRAHLHLRLRSNKVTISPPQFSSTNGLLPQLRTPSFLSSRPGQRVSRRKYATIRPFINRDVVHMDKRRSSSIVWSIYLRCEQEDATAEVGGGDGTPQVQDRVVACVAMATIMK